MPAGTLEVPTGAVRALDKSWRPEAGFGDVWFPTGEVVCYTTFLPG